MTAIDQLRFTVPEILSLIGLTQSVYLLVYMLLHAGDRRRAVLPFLYFLVLGGAFFLDFAARFISGIVPHYAVWEWAAWYMGPPLSVLLILQIARISAMPSWLNGWVLLLIPLSGAAAWGFARRDKTCSFPHDCMIFQDWLTLAGLIAGGVSLLTIWAHRGLLDGMKAEKAGKDRYWLILTLICMNSLFLGAMLVSLTPAMDETAAHIIRTLLGLSFLYLAGTSLFRIYPQAVQIVSRRPGTGIMSTQERLLAERIETLLDRDKIYQEPSYTRADLARELQTPENVLSKIINLHFGKSFPQLLNERRVEDAKRLLAETDAPVKIIAGEVGFNSMASFNRVFRDLAGSTPTLYRNEHSKRG